jgi:DNA-binding LacI/PurR family transcriptional regulator
MLSRSTLYEVAQIANVSSAEVLAVIVGREDVAPAVRARVQTAMKLSQNFQRYASGYRVENSLAIIIPHRVVEDEYVGAVIQGAADETKQHGFELLIQIYNPDDRSDLAGILNDACVFGVIVAAPLQPDDMGALHSGANMPLIFVDYQGELTFDDALIIEANNRAGIRQIMNHLFELGHRRIGFITGALSYASAQQRLEAYRAALAEAGIAYDEALVGEGDWLHPQAYELTTALLRLENPPTAIVASNDLSAMGAMQAAKEAGLTIGEQISITGFDDIPMARIVSPSLTTVRQPTYDLGSVAVKMVLKHLRGEAIRERHVQVATELVVRESTGPAPRDGFYFEDQTDDQPHISG